jgi:hypothetical protein
MGSSVYFDREKHSFVGLTDDVKSRLKLWYPLVNIEVELMKMEDWLLSDKGKGRKGSITFITNWLSKVYIKPVETSEGPILSPEQKNYLKDLWKNREHILMMNQRRA